MDDREDGELEDGELDSEDDGPPPPNVQQMEPPIVDKGKIPFILMLN